MWKYCRGVIIWDRPPLFQVCEVVATVDVETAQLVLSQFKNF